MSARMGIFYEKAGKTIHIQLTGIFDGTSAEELLSAINRNSQAAKKIVIHTNSLQSIHPYGQVLFTHKYPFLKKDSVKMIITGKNRDKMIPKRNEPSWVNI